MKFRLIAIVVIYLLTGQTGVVVAGPACCVSADVNTSNLAADDLGGAGLDEALAASLRFMKKRPRARKYRLCDQDFTVAELIEGLTEFQELFRRNGHSNDFVTKVREHFDICGAVGENGEGKVMVTGYFEPVLDGSLQRKPPFIYPLYRVPNNLVKKNGNIGRMQDDQFLSYWTRAQIEEEDLLAGNELVYLNDPVEAFILHIQGSGRVRLRDGTLRRVQFAAKNGLPYRSIGRLLADSGRMELSEVNLPVIVNYLNEHPEERKDILYHNESYIFFRWGNNGDSGPLGRISEPLTTDRSVALDHDCFPPGGLGFLKSRKPIFNDNDEIIGWAPMSRFVVNQDSGSAIRGPGRVDLFLGAGNRARMTAGIMKHPGRLYFLVKKK
ncbi:MAG: MltA domain-containing protein [Thermodesulfobacteriota bacterium]